ncbi:ATP synthase subunit [Trichostrongylus colubriformis]|uniref:ATP synthase subunit n=1 Tax=Trichostrongylus colubriformis TaxID=6319 RepID=A0AAN8ID73_TRICO
MATHKMNFFEKMANMLGYLYRHQAAQFPRRWEILKAVGKHELAPPKTSDWPAIKADWKKVTQFIASKQYKQLTVREALVYTAVGMEVIFWFFVGEMIGRRNIPGYLVPPDYVSKETRKKVKALEAEARENALHH